MIKNGNDLIFLNQFSSIVELSDLEALNAGVDYDIIDNSDKNATVVSSKELLMGKAFDIEPGSSISINIDGFYFKHIVDNIDTTKTKILLAESIYNKDDEIIESGSIQVKRTDNYTIKLNDLNEGHYLIKPGNIKLVVRDSYVQPYVSLSEISAKLSDASNLKQSRLESLNKVGLKMIYSDLSGFDNYYDIIDEIDLWKMLFIKIECLLTTDYEFKQEWYNPCANYKNLLMTYKPLKKFEENQDGTPSEEITEPETASWTL